MRGGGYLFQVRYTRKERNHSWILFELSFGKWIGSLGTQISSMKERYTSEVYVCAYRFERASSVWTLNSWPKIVCRFIRRENKHTWWTSWRLLGLFSSHVHPLISHTGIMCVRNWNHGLNSDVYKSYRDKNRIFICIKNSQQPSWNIGTVLSMRVLISFFQNIDLSYISKIG